MKRLLSILLISLAGSFCLNATLYDPVFLTLNRESGIYSVGDTAIIFARSTNPGETLHLLITEDGNILVDSAIVMTSEPKPIYSEICNRSKWIMARLSPYGAKVNDYSSAGFVVDPQEFKPAFKAPSDLYRYWQKEIRKMRKSKMEVTAQEVATPKEYKGKIKCWHVTISMPEGRAVNGYVAVPDDSLKHPIFLCTHGATSITGVKVRSSLEKIMPKAARGSIAMDINAHGILDGADKEYYEKMAEELKDYQLQKATDRESYYFRLMYLRVIRALDYLTTLEGWNRKEVMVSGESQGGAQALFAGAVDHRVTHVRASVPAITNLGGWNEGYQSGWPCNILEMKEYVASEEGKKVLPYFDNSLLISRYKGELYIDVGFIDITCAPNDVYATFNNARKARKVIFPYVYRRHYGADPRYRQEMETAREKVLGPFLESLFPESISG